MRIDEVGVAASGVRSTRGAHGRRLLRTSTWAASIALACAASVQAAPVDFACGGVILDPVVDTHGVLDGSIVPMGRLSCRVHYETPGVDGFPSEPDVGSYFQSPPAGQLRVEIGSYVLEVPMSIPVRFGTLDDWRGGSSEPFKDSFSWSMEGANFPFPATPDVVLEQLRFAMDTLDTSALASDALPPAPLDITDFPNPDIRRFAITGCRVTELSGTFCSPTPTIAIYGIIDTVPEPGAVASCLACLGALGALARRSR